MSYYAKHVFFCCNQRDGTERTCLQRQGRVGDARLREEAASRRSASPAKARSASTRRAASTAARKGPASWSTRTRSGTPTSTGRHRRDHRGAPAARAHRRAACGLDAGEHPARVRRRRRRAGSNARSTSRDGVARAASRSSPIRIRCSAARSTTRWCRRSRAPSSSSATRPGGRISAASARPRACTTKAGANSKTLQAVLERHQEPRNSCWRAFRSAPRSQRQARRNESKPECAWCWSASAVTRIRRRRCPPARW